jgi:hypothetical protein
MAPTSLAKRRVTGSFSAKRAEFQFILVRRSTSAHRPDAVAAFLEFAIAFVISAVGGRDWCADCGCRSAPAGLAGVSEVWSAVDRPGLSDVDGQRGGAWTAVNRWVKALCQGHRSGRCRWMVRARWASRAATWMSSRRMVAALALA